MTGTEATSPEDRDDRGTSGSEVGRPVASSADSAPEPDSSGSVIREEFDSIAETAPSDDSAAVENPSVEPDTDETRPLENDPDRADVLRAREGDESAFEVLIERHQNWVYSKIYFMVFDRQIAEDLSQEAFFRAFTGLRSFRFEAKFTTWLGRIATNVTLHHFERRRAQKRTGRTISIDASRDHSESGGQLEIPDRSYLPEEWAIRNERQKAIVHAVSELPDDFRAALAMRELEQLSYQEISESLGLPIGTVKSKIFRARQILQEKLKGVL